MIDEMRRRDFLAALAASLAAPSWLSARTQPHQPRLLIGTSDPFTGLPALKTRFAAGLRPSEDMEGWALSWRLSGQESFAERALNEMRTKHIAGGGKASRSWLDYARWALAFDWLRGFRGFERPLQDRVAQELQEGAAAMLATADFSNPSEYSYHNYSLRYLALPAFACAAIEDYPGSEGRAKTWRNKVAECLANVLDTSSFVSPEGSYHESMDYMRITWASLVMIAELQRTTTGVDPAFHFSVFRNIGNTYLYKLLPDGTPSREGDNEYPILDARDTACSATRSTASKILTARGFSARADSAPGSGCSQSCNSCGMIPKSRRVTPPLPGESELPRQRFFLRCRASGDAGRMEARFHLD